MRAWRASRRGVPARAPKRPAIQGPERPGTASFESAPWRTSRRPLKHRPCQEQGRSFERKTRFWLGRQRKSGVAPLWRLRSAMELAAVDPVALHPALHLDARLAQDAGRGGHVPTALAERRDDLLAAAAFRLGQPLRGCSARRTLIRQARRDRL